MNSGIHLEHDWFPRSLPVNVTIGPRSWCYSSFAFLHYRSKQPCGVRIGQDSGIYHGSFFELGPHGEVQIGNYCTLVGVIIATNTRVVIEDYAFLAHEVVLADSFAAVTRRAGDRSSETVDSETPRDLGIFIGENSWIGAKAVLLGGARIGAGAIIGAAAVVDFEVAPYTIVAGNPAREVGKIRSVDRSIAGGNVRQL